MPAGCTVDVPFRVDSDLAKELAAKYGTPLYVVCESCLRGKMREYRAAFAAAYDKTELSFASKANSTLAILKIAHEEGLLIDAASEGEMRAALLAGVSASSIEFHGNNKSEEEIVFALGQGVRTIIADNFEELDTLSHLWRPEYSTRVVLRLAPGVDPHTQEKISTGQDDTKFGFNVSNGHAERALLKALGAGLPVAGFHCHVGSQLLDPQAQINGGETLASFALAMFENHGFVADVINLGGGLGIQYAGDERPVAVDDYCARLVRAVLSCLKGSALRPTLIQEPGRSLVGACGITLYTVGVVKSVPTHSGPKVYVVVDGGLADNPRPVMYGARFGVEALRRSNAAPMPCTVSGRHCETDKLFPNVELPGDVTRGDLIQVLSTGAYNSSMASNYNRYPRPATVLLREGGSHCLIQRRENWTDMFARELMPEDL